jgi:perosamine synthetase
MKRIPHNKLSLSLVEQNVANKVIRSGWLAQGKEVELFENEFSEYHNLPHGHAVAFSSCSTALFSAIYVLCSSIKRFDIPVYVSRILQGAIALNNKKFNYLDISDDSPNISSEEIIKSNSDAIIIPHMFGIPFDFTKIDLSKYKFVIENCSHSLGSSINGKLTGLFGDIAVFSFNATKVITAGGVGGMIISRKKNYINLIRSFRDFDNQKQIKNNLNFKMGDLNAAIGRSQLRNLGEFLSKREKIFQIYKTVGLDLIDTNNKNISPIRYRAILKTNKPLELIRYLKNHNIDAIVPIEKWELLSKDKMKFKNSLFLSENSVSLPLYPLLSLDKAKYIARVLANFK